MVNPKRALGATSTLALVLVPTAFAQSQVATPSEAATAAKDHGGLEIVVVTARRREEDVQSTPVTLTAFSGEALQEKGISDFTRLAQATPGINFDTFPRSDSCICSQTSSVQFPSVRQGESP